MHTSPFELYLSTHRPILTITFTDVSFNIKQLTWIQMLHHVHCIRVMNQSINENFLCQKTRAIPIDYSLLYTYYLVEFNVIFEPDCLTTMSQYCKHRDECLITRNACVNLVVNQNTSTTEHEME